MTAEIKTKHHQRLTSDGVCDTVTPGGAADFQSAGQNLNRLISAAAYYNVRLHFERS